MVNVDLYSAIITKVSNAITVTNISQCFCLQDGGKNRLAQVWKKITSLLPYVYLKAATGRELSTDRLRFQLSSQ